jgi:hypothetical protein
MRYRIQTEEGRVWDTKQKRTVTVESGEYNTYKSFGRAVSVARKIEINYGFVIVENTQFAGRKKYKTAEEAAASGALSKKEYLSFI